MKIDLSQFREMFLQESAEHIATIESGLLKLRATPTDAELLNLIFRSAHSIKGGAGAVGLDSLVQFTHTLESLLDQLREARVPVTEEVVSVLIESVDVLHILLAAEPKSELSAAALQLIERMQALTVHAEEPTADAGPEVTSRTLCESPKAEADQLAFYRIEFRPDREMFLSGTNPIVLLRNLNELGQVSATELHRDELPALSDLDPAQCYLSWTIEIATVRPESELQEVFEFVGHVAEVSIRRLDSPQPDLRTNAAMTCASGKAPAAARQQVIRPSQSQKKGPQNKPAVGEAASIRVSTEKVDRLIDLVGELVIAHVMAAQMVERFTLGCLPKLRDAVESMERNTRELHERVMAIRMLPVGTLFQRFVRTVYDIARSTDKEIELVTSGEETEIDKGMLELLADPLTHIIRNSADHGIELPEVRTAAGKPAQGTINLCAFHRAGRIVIEVSDDGAGINLERVRAKAIDRGLIAEEAHLSDDQIRMLIFEPGFSTKDAVSDLSGRGVGMDVVRQNVRQMNGAVTISSEEGHGTTVSIELPLTLAILEGLLIGVGGRTLVLPLLSVLETVSPRPGQIQRVAEKGDVVVIRGESIPLLRLHRFIGIESSSKTDAGSERDSGNRSLVVVVDAGRNKFGLVVDELLGQQQVVVKSLESNLRKIDGLMGATILGDGGVAPIVDVASLATMNLFSIGDGNPRRPVAACDPGQSESATLVEREESANAMV